MQSRKSLHIFMLHAAVLMAGYTTIRCSLALYLQQSTHSTNSSLTITTSALALQVICSFFWSLILKYCKAPTYNKLVLNGGVMMVFGIVVMTLLNFCLTTLLIGVATYIAGASLYVLNFYTLVNAHTEDPSIRQNFNQRIFFCLNVGSLLGIFAGAWLMNLISTWLPQLRYVVLYMAGGLAILGALKLLEAKQKLLCEIPADESTNIFKSRLWLLFFTATLIGLLVLLLENEMITRAMIITAFITTFLYILLFSKNSSANKIRLASIISGNLAYKTSMILIYVSLSLYLSHVSQLRLFGEKMPVLFFYIFDPVANLIVGTIVLFVLRAKFKKNNYQCALGLLLISLSFAISTLYAWVSINGEAQQFASILIIITISLFGAGEFLLAPTLVAQTGNLAPTKSSIRSYMGLLELSSATGMVIAFYLISLTEKAGTSPALITPPQLYSIQFLLLLFISATICTFTYLLKNNHSKVLQHV